MTHCNKNTIKFKALGKRSVVSDFNGGTITSDAGALLLDNSTKPNKQSDYYTGQQNALSIIAIQILSNTPSSN